MSATIDTLRVPNPSELPPLPAWGRFRPFSFEDLEFTFGEPTKRMIASAEKCGVTYEQAADTLRLDFHGFRAVPVGLVGRWVPVRDYRESSVALGDDVALAFVAAARRKDRDPSQAPVALFAGSSFHEAAGGISLCVLGAIRGSPALEGHADMIERLALSMRDSTLRDQLRKLESRLHEMADAFSDEAEDTATVVLQEAWNALYDLRTNPELYSPDLADMQEKRIRLAVAQAKEERRDEILQRKIQAAAAADRVRRKMAAWCKWKPSHNGRLRPESRLSDPE